MHKVLRALALFTTLSLLSGCAAAALTAGGVAGGAGVNYTLNGIVYKTFTSPVKDMRRATLHGLKAMDIKVTKDKVADYGWQIEGTAYDRTINIELQRLTPSTTRMRVVTNEGAFFKDTSTSTEIIKQTAQRVETASARAD